MKFVRCCVTIRSAVMSSFFSTDVRQWSSASIPGRHRSGNLGRSLSPSRPDYRRLHRRIPKRTRICYSMDAGWLISSQQGGDTGAIKQGCPSVFGSPLVRKALSYTDSAFLTSFTSSVYAVLKSRTWILGRNAGLNTTRARSCCERLWNGWASSTGSMIG
jgi:hypothetical protein